MSSLLTRLNLGGGPGFRTLMRTEARMFLREPSALFWCMLFPVVLLVIIGAATGNKHEASFGGLRFIDVYTPTLFVFAFGLVCVQIMPATLVSYRQKGYLRRLSTTPVGAARLLQAQWTIYTALCIALSLVLIAVAGLAFSVHFPTQFLGFVIILLLTAGATLAVGTLVGSVAPTPRTSQVIGGVSFYVLMFFAGLWVPLQTMGSTLRTIAHCTPLGASVTAIDQTMAGRWPPGWTFLCLVAWMAIAGRVSIRVFKWE